MNNEILINQISKITSLSIKEVEIFISMGVHKEISKKTYLAAPHKTVNKAYFLKSGITRHFVYNDSKEFTKNITRGPRFLLPSLSDFFLEKPSTIYCEAITEIDVIEWQRKDLYRFADKHPVMYKFLLKGVVKAFQNKEIKEIGLNKYTAKQRYLNFMDEYPNLINEIPLRYVASFLGIRPKTLSRIRANMFS